MGNKNKTFIIVISIIVILCLSLVLFLISTADYSKKIDYETNPITSSNNITSELYEYGEFEYVMVEGYNYKDGTVSYMEALAKTMLKAIEGNKNLTKKNKELANKTYDYLVDNPFLKWDELYDKLLNLDIIDYDIDNSIKFSLSDRKVNIVRYVIEYTGNETGNIVVDKGMSILLTNEYYFDGKKVTPNDKVVTLVKILCELVGTNAVLDSFSKGDLTSIYNELEKVYNEDNAPKRFMSSINDLGNAIVNGEDFTSEYNIFNDLLTYYLNREVTDDSIKLRDVDTDIINMYLEYIKDTTIPTRFKIYYNLKLIKSIY